MRNIFERLSPKAIRLIYGGMALIVVALGAANIHQVMVVRVVGNDQCRWVKVEQEASRLLITDIVRGGVTDQAGVRDGDHLLRINGMEFKSDQHAQSMINAVAGGTARYTIERKGQQFEVDVLIPKAINMSFLALTLQGGSLLLTTGDREENGIPGGYVAVADSGPGIAPEIRERLFDPFFTTKTSDGTGLGLWVSQGLVQRYGGRIGVDCPPSGGSVFTVWLPNEAQAA